MLSGSRSGLDPALIGATIFKEGDVLGTRYEILQLLGIGGMGAVYKARDMEVERIVALKVIRSDLAGNPAILARFKQELVLARQITHKNIVRIYDLNEADGVKFITMEFIEGESLRSVLVRQGKLPPAEAVGIMLQVCAGLQAAHTEGVIHRDLKPSNIMRDPGGRVVIMDFGLARTIQGDGMTQTGMMIGTMEYMSPEQAMGKDLDARSDEFAAGLIFYELLSGVIPFHAESAIASLVKRTQERAVPLAEVDANIPPELSHIVGKCLERDPADRFATLQDLVDELEVWQGQKPRTGKSVMTRPAVGKGGPAGAKPQPVKWIAGGVAAVALVIAAIVGVRYGTHSRASTTTGQQSAVTALAIVPFYNATGNTGLDWMGGSIAAALSSDIGQSQHLRLVSPDRLQQALQYLRVSPQSQLGASELKRIAEYTNAETTVYGQYERFGDQIQITATVHDLHNDREISAKVDVANEKDLLSSVEKLAGDVREKLAVSSETLKELQSGSQHVLTKSVPAMRAYDEGLQLAATGWNIQAVSKFEEATVQDPGFAMAFSRLAQTYAALGYDSKAAQASRRAMELRENLSPADRLLVQAVHYSVLHDNSKAIAAYQDIEKTNPDDTSVQFALAKLYEDANNYPDAKKYLTKVLAAAPNYVAALLAQGRVAIRSGDPQAALDPLNKALSLAIQFGNQEQKGEILQVLGIAYQYLNKPEDALRNFQQALEIRRKIGDARGIAYSLGQIGQVQDGMGNPQAALASYQESVKVARTIDDRKGLTLSLMWLGSFYLDHGKYDDGLKYTNEALQIARDTGDQISQATLLLNVGGARYAHGEYQDALTDFQQCYDIRKSLNVPDPDCLHNTAYTNVKLGEYDTALNQYLTAMEAAHTSGDKGNAALLSNDMGALFAAQGRYGAALKAQQEAVNAYQQVGDRSYLMVSALTEYGHTLAAAGREDESQKNLDEALKLAAQVKNDEFTAAALNDLGDSFFFAGNYAAAQQQYDKALQLAKKAKVPEQQLLAELNLAKLQVAQGKAQAAIPQLNKLKDETDAKGLKAESVIASIYLGEALLAANRADAARQELDSALGRAEKLGLRVEQARAQYLLGAALTRAGKPKEAAPHYLEAVRLLQSISKEEGAARVLERSDLKDFYRDAMKASQGAT